MEMSLLCNYSMDEELLELLVRFEHSYDNLHRAYASVHRILSPIICGLSVLANVAFITVLSRPSLRTSVNVFLLGIAVSNMILMSCYFLVSFKPQCMGVLWAYFILAYTSLPMAANSCSLWLTVIMALLRYHWLRKTGAAVAPAWLRRSVLVVVLTALCVCLICFPNFMRSKVDSPSPSEVESVCITDRDNNTSGNFYIVKRPDYWNCTLEWINFWMIGILFKLIPCFLLTIFMSLLIRTLFQTELHHRRVQERHSPHHKRTTVILVMIVLIFLVTELPKAITLIVIGIYPRYFVMHYYFGDLLDLLSLIENSINFVLYCAMSAQFRTEAAQTLGLGRFFPAEPGQLDRLLQSRQRQSASRARSRPLQRQNDSEVLELAEGRPDQPLDVIEWECSV